MVALAYAWAQTFGVGCVEKAPAASSLPPLLIGVSLGLTNGLAPFAKPLRDAIRVAEGQINAAGGILGRTVKFDVQDDQSDETKGIVERVANDFVQRGAIAVIGPLGSQQVAKTQAIYANANVLQITPSATSTDLTAIQPADDRWLFRTTPADDFQAAAVLLLAKRTPSGLGEKKLSIDAGAPATCTRLAVVYVDNSYGKSMTDALEASFPRRNAGQLLLTRRSVAVDLVPSYAKLAGDILNLNPQCLALIAYDDVAAAFVRDLKKDPRYVGLAANGFFLLGTDGVYTEGFLVKGRASESDPTSANASEGVFGTAPDTQPETREYSAFRTLYSSYFPLGVKEAPSFTANTFDAAILLALAIQRAGGVADRKQIRQALFEVSAPPGRPYTPSQLGEALLAVKLGEDIDYTGASGSVDLEPNGNVKSGFVVWEAYRTPDKKVDYRTVGRFTLDELQEQFK